MEDYLFSLINEVLYPISVTCIDFQKGILVLWVDKSKYTHISWKELKTRLGEEVDIYLEYSLVKNNKDIKGWEFYEKDIT